ncbi:hypothetical protein N8I77_013506 [Diaporthe amygdali]|uniref:SMP-30/Gluconolactonase/LRE-like region domain-containing protein n=1 Tax=Phomopsis amygdali TaxID=1214568 RepID=A0AAD9VYI3_PHOAM|nr:hypothetical protein N8I77_013506 [Diaporthe amygdali]
MGFEHGSKFGKMYALSGGSGDSWEAPLVQEGVTCTNGMAWSKNGTTMYFTDSWVKEIVTFDYDLSSGKMENRRVLSNLQDYGEPDGMCQDTDGGIWTCRWQAGKVIRLTESGEVDVIIDFPTAWHMTCCIFGGENNDELYVTTAASDYNGEILPDRFDGGSLFVVKGLGFTGVERGRFSGSVETLP